MSTRIAIISDTHIPSRASEIPDWVLDELDVADRAIHAGDFDTYDSHDRVQEVTPDLTAVLGNIDPPDLDVPEVATLASGSSSPTAPVASPATRSASAASSPSTPRPTDSRSALPATPTSRPSGNTRGTAV